MAQQRFPLRSEAYARAGLLGNPSDGYFGKTIAITVKNFRALVELHESPKLCIREPEQDAASYGSLHELAEKVNLYGYYGGTRIIKASLKKFHDYCLNQKIPLGQKNCTITYDSTIPRQLGLGGSSAIIVAAMRSLMKFFQVEIPLEILPTLVLEAERDELGINAGFMDRVVQVYEGCIYMDLDPTIIKEKGHGLYERIDTSLLPQLYLAFKSDLGKVSGQVLNEIRVAYERGESSVIEVLRQIAEIADLGKQALLRGDHDSFFDLMNKNFDLRSKIMRISADNHELIRTARGCGASAKFAGSGGSVIGMYRGEEMFSRLTSELGKIRARVIKPDIG